MVTDLLIILVVAAVIVVVAVVVVFEDLLAQFYLQLMLAENKLMIKFSTRTIIKWQQKFLTFCADTAAAEFEAGKKTTTINTGTIKSNRFITDNWMQLDLETTPEVLEFNLLMKIYGTDIHGCKHNGGSR